MTYGRSSRTPQRPAGHMPRAASSARPARSARSARTRRGAMMVVVALLLPASFVVAAMTVHVAYSELLHTETQIAVDVSTRAAGLVYTRTGDRDQAIAAAQQFGLRNTVGGSPFEIAPDQIAFGAARRFELDARYDFQATNTPDNPANINAVRLVSKPASSNQKTASLWSGLSRPSGLPRPIEAMVVQPELDLALVIDRSASMAFAWDEQPRPNTTPAAAPEGWTYGDALPPTSRWHDTQSAVRDLLAQFQQSPQTERVSLTTYGSDANIDVLISADYGEVAASLEHYAAQFPEQQTNIGDGLRAGLHSLELARGSRPWAINALVLVTDGVDNTGLDPYTALTRAAELNIPVFTVTLSDQADQATMRNIAALTGGEHFHATSPADLSKALRTIARRLPTLLTR